MRSQAQIDRVSELLKFNVDEMNGHQLNEMAAHLISEQVTVDDENHTVTIHLNGHEPRVFSPTTSGDDVLYLMTNVEGGMSLSSHVPCQEDAKDGEEPWYSAHSYISGTTVQSYADIKTVFCRSAAKLLAIDFSYQSAWGK